MPPQNYAQVSKETLLKTAKEITVKFIETGRISPASFNTSFRNIYQSIEKTLYQTENSDCRETHD